MSRKMLFALAGVAVLLAGSLAWKADAAAPIGVSSLWLLGTGPWLGLGSSSLLVARRCSRLQLVVSEIRASA